MIHKNKVYYKDRKDAVLAKQTASFVMIEHKDT